MFAQTVFMEPLIKSLDRMIAESPDNASAIRKDTLLRTIIGKFFASFNEQKADASKNCVDRKGQTQAGHSQKRQSMLDV